MRNLLTRWRDLPLGTRLAIFTSLLVLAVALILTLASIQREDASFRSELEAQADLVLEAFAYNLRDPLYRSRLDEIEDIVVVAAESDVVTLLNVYDRRGILVVESATQGTVFNLDPDPVGLKLTELTRGAPPYFDWQADRLLAGRAIYVGNHLVGAVSVGLSRQPLQQKLTALTLQASAIAGLMIAAGIILTVLLTRQIVLPLSELTQAVTRLSEGTYTIRVRQKTNDEIGRLAGGFNKMAEVIQRRDTDLRDLAAGLDQLVKERTAELEAQNKELVVARKQAEEASKLKSQFLATVSHELRTPLNSIMGFSQLLLMGAVGELNERQHERVERIFASGQELLTLINNLLDLAKIEAGRTEIVKRSFALRPWVEETTRQVETMTQQKALVFTANVRDTMPDYLVGDPDRLKQIVINLLSNAFKFSEKGSVKLDIHRVDKASWTIAVSDTGVGIPSHALEYIFDEFRQVDSSPQREYSGTGLGLAIVRNLALLMGGSVRVSSKVGEGSTFTVQLPLETEATPQPTGEARPG